MKKIIKTLLFIAITATAFTACKKENNNANPSDQPIKDSTKDSILGGGGNTTLSYGDTIFYIRTGATNIISPINFNKQGTFYGFPKGIELDSITGKIDLMESETGLRYRIMFVPKGTIDTISTKIIISGINFYDGIYRLSQGDSIAKSIYNANGLPFVPGQFGCGLFNVFDDGNGCNSQGCAVSLINGNINLAKSLRDNAISSTHDSQKEFTYYYRMDDRSEKTLNKLKVKLYFYNKVADIPQYLWDILLIEHAGTILTRPKIGSDLIEITPQGTQGVTGINAKPRPPCIIIIMN